MNINCSSWWWYGKTLYGPGSVVKDVPEGTSVPAGFYVDGKMVPKKERKTDSRDVKIAQLEAENATLKTENQSKTSGEKTSSHRSPKE